jgi:hypothetical protein
MATVAQTPLKAKPATLYNVTYHETEYTALIDAAAIRALPTTNVTMEDVLDNCKEYRVTAQTTYTPRPEACAPTIRAKYARVYDEPARIAKVNGALYVIYEDGRIADFEIEMAPWTTILGDVAISETQAMWDRVAGGAAAIACGRQEGRS